MIEEIRLTILNNLLQYHPESAEELAWGPKVRKPSSFDSTAPLGLANRSHVVDTYIDVAENDAGTFTVINLRTTDRPGLLVDIVRVLKDINVNVVSAEVDTEGKQAVDTFYVTYVAGLTWGRGSSRHCRQQVPRRASQLVHGAAGDQVRCWVDVTAAVVVHRRPTAACSITSAWRRWSEKRATDQ